MAKGNLYIVFHHTAQHTPGIDTDKTTTYAVLKPKERATGGRARQLHIKYLTSNVVPRDRVVVQRIHHVGRAFSKQVETQATNTHTHTHTYIL